MLSDLLRKLNELIAAITAGNESTAAEVTTEITWSAGTSASPTIDTAGYRSVGFVLPATFTGNAMYIQGSYDGTNYTNIYDRAGVLVSVPISQGRSYTLPADDILPYRYIKLASVTDAVAVNQGSARTLQIVMRS